MPHFFAVACFCWIFFLLEYEGLSVPFSASPSFLLAINVYNTWMEN